MAVAPYLKKIDAFEFESRFSTDQMIRYDELRDSNSSLDEIWPLLDRLPPREVDLIELYYKRNKNQKDIARIFGVTQGAISSRLSRARARLRFLRDLPKITESEIDQDLKECFNPLEIEIIKGMIKTTCQSETATLINEKLDLVDPKRRMTQVKVRHRFEKCIIKLEITIKARPELKKYRDLLIFIKSNLYKLHEVVLPHFDRGHRAVFSLDS